MQKRKERVLKVIVIVGIILLSFQTEMYAHSGKTDANGGHRDNKNKSGLGSYHYHCGGYPAHLHTNGICPYKSSSSTNSSSSNSSKKSTTSSASKTSSISNNNQEKKDIDVTAVQIKNKENTNLKIGESLVVEAKIEPKNATNKTITWTSSDVNIATVDSNGKVEAIKEGKVKIIAKNNNKEDSIEINIEKPVIEVSKIVLDKNDITLKEGERVTITGVIHPINATDKTVTFESSDESIAKVENGKVIAIKEGTTTIVATASNGVKNICNINVKKKEEKAVNETNNKVNNENKNSNGNIITPATVGTFIFGKNAMGLTLGLILNKSKGKH